MTAPSPVVSPNPLRFSTIWLAAYVIVMSGVAAGIFYGRHQAFQTYGSENAHSAWTAWREDVKAAQTEGPVRRRIPKSTEPPALVLMRDYFATCLIASLLLTTILFLTFMIFIRGALTSPHLSRLKT